MNGEPGALITVTETASGKLDFRVCVTDLITGTHDRADVGDLRGLFFHVADEDVLQGLSISGPDVTDYEVSANKISNLKGGVNMNGEVGKTSGAFDIGIEFGTSGIGKDDIRDTSFTLAASEPLSLDLVLQQYFGVRLTSVSNNGVGRESSLKLVGQLTGSPRPVDPPTGGQDPADPPPADPNDPVDPDPADPGQTGPEPTNPIPGVSYDDLIEAGDGNDTIYGGRGNDEMQGEGGDDLIIGGTDDGRLDWEDGLSVTIGDNLYGNDGNDTYLYKDGDGVDLIWDFRAGEDLIKVTGYTAQSIVGVTFVNRVANRIKTPEHDKIALILNENGDAIVFNDFPEPEDKNATVVRFADGSTLSYADLQALARANPLAGGSPGTSAAAPAGASVASGPRATPLELIGGNDEDTLIGGAGNDRLYGNEGVNGLNGRGGNDELYGGNVRDIMLGEDGDDIGYGNGGDDLIIGGGGSDKLYGAGGNDVIFGDDGEGVDLPALLTAYLPAPPGEEVRATIRITKNWWGGFEGEIKITANESIANWGILLRSKFNLDNVWGAQAVTETSWSKGIVYGLDNASWNGMLSVGQTTTIGFTARTGVNGIVDPVDLLAGLAIVTDASTAEPVGMNVTNILGNTVRGAAGADVLVGTKRNDTYYVDNSRDKVVETTSGGTADKVVASVSHALVNHVENLTAMAGTAAVNLTGNALANRIVGNSGANKLSGGYGNDVLSGGKGEDTFVFDKKLSKTSNVDRITDFNVKDDTIQLDNAVFKKLGNTGKLKKDFFALDCARDANDYVIYNAKSGILYYDADGSGSGAAVAFAKVDAKLKLKITWSDFSVI